MTTIIEYTCAACGQSFWSEWSEADAAAEYGREFSLAEKARPRDLVCDVCYAVIMLYRMDRGRMARDPIHGSGASGPGSFNSRILS